MLKSKLNVVLVYGLLLTSMGSISTRLAQAQQSRYAGQNGESRTIFLDPQQPLFLWVLSLAVFAPAAPSVPERFKNNGCCGSRKIVRDSPFWPA